MLLNPYRFSSGGGGGATDANWADVALLLHLDGGFADASTTPKTVVGAGGLSTSAGAGKFSEGVQCAYGQYIEVSAHNDLRFSGAFTFEFWMRSTSSGGLPTWNDQDIFSTVSQSVYIQIRNAQLQMTFFGSMMYFRIDMAGDTAWHHIAITRDASNLVRVFQDGVQVATRTTASGDASATGWVFGWITSVAAKPYTGKLDEIRFTKGVCRYASNFTPPADPFPDS